MVVHFVQEWDGWWDIFKRIKSGGIRDMVVRSVQLDDKFISNFGCFKSIMLSSGRLQPVGYYNLSAFISVERHRRPP